MNPRVWFRRLLGEKGEREASRFLRKRGMRVLTRGYRCPMGEIDLVVREKDVLVFVEVKTRRKGEPFEAVDPEKQRRVTLTALHFLRRYDLPDQAHRFDVVAIVWPEDARKPMIEHYRNAFEPVGRYQMFR